MYFPNGLVLAPNGEFLLVNETARFRIARYWLRGDKQGSWDYFAENVPLLIDNISVDAAGNYLLAGMPRMPLMDALQSKAWLKSQIAKLPLGLLRQEVGMEFKPTHDTQNGHENGGCCGRYAHSSYKFARYVAGQSRPPYNPVLRLCTQ